MRDDWRRIRLGEVAALDIEKVRVESGRGYPIAGVLNAGQGLFQRDPIDSSQTNYATLHRLRAGQLVMRKLTAWEGPITCVPREYDGYLVSAEFPTFTLGPDLLPTYMSVICQRPEFWESMKDRSTGSVQRRKRVSPSELLAIEIDLPPLAEQRRIVDLAQALDHTLAAAGTALKRLDDLMLSLIEDRVFAQDYAWQTLGTLALPRGLAGGPFGSDLTTSNFVPEGVPVLQGSNLTGAAPYVSGPFKFVSPQKASTLTNNLAEPGDVVATQRGTLGQVALLPRDGYGSYVVSQSQMRLRVDPARVSAEYAYLALSSRRLVSEVLRQKIATANPHINLGIFGRLSIPAPPLAVQAEIVDLVFGVLAQKEATRAVAESTARLRSAITADLLSGNHEIPDSYDRFLDGAA
jgi:type I restriction enzyme S subunit